LPLLALISLSAGCQSNCCHKRPNTAKSSLETGLGTAIYPNAPYDKHEYPIEKIDVSIKFKREW
jgi:hypothetical protein